MTLSRDTFREFIVWYIDRYGKSSFSVYRTEEGKPFMPTAEMWYDKLKHLEEYKFLNAVTHLVGSKSYRFGYQDVIDYINEVYPKKNSIDFPPQPINLTSREKNSAQLKKMADLCSQVGKGKIDENWKHDYFCFLYDLLGEGEMRRMSLSIFEIEEWFSRGGHHGIKKDEPIRNDSEPSERREDTDSNSSSRKLQLFSAGSKNTGS